MLFFTLFYSLLDLRSSECNVVSLYVVCCSVNVSVCFVCCVLDSVCELLGETIRNVSSFIVSINLFPVSRVPSAKGLLEYCFLYASYRLCDSSVSPGMQFVLHPLGMCLLDKIYVIIVVFWDRFNLFDGFIQNPLRNRPI